MATTLFVWEMTSWSNCGTIRRGFQSVGRGHASNVTACCFSPCRKLIITGAADGSIFIWRIPDSLIFKAEETETVKSSATCSSRTSNLTKAKYSYKPEENVCNSLRRK